MMYKMNIREELDSKGYCIVPNVLNEQECSQVYDMFHDWKKNIPNHDKLHNNIDPHGIYKYMEAGHTKHAWFIRTRDKVQNVFKELWNCDELIVSFDGACYIPKNFKKKDKCWTHSDQAPLSKGLQCIQGFVSITENKERTFVAYEDTHKMHYQFFKDKGIQNNKNWNKIPENDIKNMSHLKRVLHVPAGSLVLWDSRMFHQNQYGEPNSEERIVQYVCFLPKNHPKNTKNMQAKRLKYFKDRRTTSHWPCPIKVNSLQPQTYGDNSRLIDYSMLNVPDLEDLMPKIIELL
uniref:Phytanoyl-Coa Dioxygenase n=1 Tax=Florenciella sp. virus SA2 TaxID=3240092 RepID=A0AB39JBJ1_9VIRU